MGEDLFIMNNTSLYGKSTLELILRNTSLSVIVGAGAGSHCNPLVVIPARVLYILTS